MQTMHKARLNPSPSQARHNGNMYPIVCRSTKMFMVLLLLIALFPTATLPAQQPPVWRVSARPTLQIGEADGDSAYLFHKAVSSLRLADGRIVVLNSGSNQLRIFDAK